MFVNIMPSLDTNCLLRWLLGDVPEQTAIISDIINSEENLTVADAALKPLLSLLIEPPYTIEPASPQERAKVEKRVREYHKNPQSFVPLKNIQ